MPKASGKGGHAADFKRCPILVPVRQFFKVILEKIGSKSSRKRGIVVSAVTDIWGIRQEDRVDVDLSWSCGRAPQVA